MADYEAPLNAQLESETKAAIDKLALQIVYAARAQDNHSFLNSTTSMRIQAAWDDDNDVPMHLTGFPVDGSPALFNVNFSEDGKHVESVFMGDDDEIDNEQSLDLLSALSVEAANIATLEPDFG